MTSTFSVAGAKDYRLVADGAIYGRVCLQIVAVYPVSVFIGSSIPTDDTEEFLSMTPDGTREVVVNLAETDRVYARMQEPVAIALRGFGESRT